MLHAFRSLATGGIATNIGQRRGGVAIYELCGDGVASYGRFQTASCPAFFSQVAL